jgi:diacylglycerol O-acyltransferase
MANKQRRSAAAPGERERLSAVDTAWLRMDAPGNPMTIVSVLTTATPVRASQLRRRIASRLSRFPRFRCRPVVDALGASWQDDDDAFALDDHWVEAVLPAPAGPEELQALAGRLAGEPLEPSRPLWQLHFVPHYRTGSAWVLRVHHCYADGLALVRVLQSLAEPEPAASARPTRTRQKPAGPDTANEGGNHHRWPLGWWLDPLVLPPGQVLRSAIAESTRWLEGGAQLAVRSEDAARFATQTRGMLDAVAHLLTLPDDPATPLRGELSGEKRVGWTAPVDLEQIRACGRALGCTVNDVLLATLAGALGAFLRDARGFDTTGLVLRASVPVNLRKDEEPATLGNRFGLLFVELPVGVVDPLQRVERMHATMQVLKGSHQPAMTLAALGVFGMLPVAVQQPALELLSRKGTLVASNVPGPREPLHLCGQRVDELHFWVPQGGTMGLGVSVLSYAGKVSFGVIADRQRLPDPQALVHHFGCELEKTLRAATTTATPAPQTAAKPRRRQRVTGTPSETGQPSPRQRRTQAPARRTPSQD